MLLLKNISRMCQQVTVVASCQMLKPHVYFQGVLIWDLIEKQGDILMMNELWPHRVSCVVFIHLLKLHLFAVASSVPSNVIPLPAVMFSVSYISRS